MPKRIAVTSPGCVACGACARSCPTGAVAIYKGIVARVNTKKCVACGKCEEACPAGVISVAAREVA
ncbi:MAG: 4Fe-4S dicluster domain-containing protein [Synergistaceae bacterium]|jgi:ferredoxin|nr:4Fe-4S dicluster domain-containing protein [Synergistaceae bacterium]